MAHVIPALAAKILYGHEAWMVGSAAVPDCDFTTVRDFDIVVPFSHWQQASLLIPADAWPNTFGGWKFLSETKEVDVWPGDLAWLLTNQAFKWAWHPRSGTRIKRHE